MLDRTDYEKQGPLHYSIKTLGLDRMENLLSLLGNPHKQVSTVHIAGTKGKSGIFKSGVPILTVNQQPEAMNVLKTQAAAVKSPIGVTGQDIDVSYRFEVSREYGPHTRICLTTPTSKFEHLRVPLHGKHQAINCGLALAMLDKLKSVGYKMCKTLAFSNNFLSL